MVYSASRYYQKIDWVRKFLIAQNISSSWCALRNCCINSSLLKAADFAFNNVSSRSLKIKKQCNKLYSYCFHVYITQRELGCSCDYIYNWCSTLIVHWPLQMWIDFVERQELDQPEFAGLWDKQAALSQVKTENKDLAKTNGAKTMSKMEQVKLHILLNSSSFVLICGDSTSSCF